MELILGGTSCQLSTPNMAQTGIASHRATPLLVVLAGVACAMMATVVLVLHYDAAHPWRHRLSHSASPDTAVVTGGRATPLPALQTDPSAYGLSSPTSDAAAGSGRSHVPMAGTPTTGEARIGRNAARQHIRAGNYAPGGHITPVRHPRTSKMVSSEQERLSVGATGAAANMLAPVITPRGTAVATAVLATSAACADGYGRTWGGGECVPCSAGNAGQGGKCTICGHDSYAMFEGSLRCLPCPVGRYGSPAKDGSAGAATCTSCAEEPEFGTWSWTADDCTAATASRDSDACRHGDSGTACCLASLCDWTPCPAHFQRQGTACVPCQEGTDSTKYQGTCTRPLGSVSDPVWNGTVLEGTLLGRYWAVETGWLRCLHLDFFAGGRVFAAAMVLYTAQAAFKVWRWQRARRRRRARIAYSKVNHGERPRGKPAKVKSQAAATWAAMLRVPGAGLNCWRLLAVGVRAAIAYSRLASASASGCADDMPEGRRACHQFVGVSSVWLLIGIGEQFVASALIAAVPTDHDFYEKSGDTEAGKLQRAHPTAIAAATWAAASQRWVAAGVFGVLAPSFVAATGLLGGAFLTLWTGHVFFVLATGITHIFMFMLAYLGLCVMAMVVACLGPCLTAVCPEGRRCESRPGDDGCSPFTANKYLCGAFVVCVPAVLMTYQLHFARWAVLRDTSYPSMEAYYGWVADPVSVLEVEIDFDVALGGLPDLVVMDVAIAAGMVLLDALAAVILAVDACCFCCTSSDTAATRPGGPRPSKPKPHSRSRLAAVVPVGMTGQDGHESES